jgi:hypothetical protein
MTEARSAVDHLTFWMTEKRNIIKMSVSRMKPITGRRNAYNHKDPMVKLNLNRISPDRGGLSFAEGIFSKMLAMVRMNIKAPMIKGMKPGPGSCNDPRLN